MRRLSSTALRPLRLAVTGAIAGALAVGMSGCSLIASQATQIQYSASDGVNVAGSGPLDVRNALIVANEDGTLANFVAAVVNTGDSEETLSVSVGEDGDRITLFVPAHRTISLGAGDAAPIALGDIGTKPGATLDMYFQSGDSSGVVAPVPVLDDSLAYLKPLAPTPAPSIEPKPTPTPTVTPTPTPISETPTPTPDE